MTANHYKTFLMARSVSEQASAAHWTGKNYRVEAARASLVQLMSGAAHDADHNEELKDIITTAILDTFEHDWCATSVWNDAAQNVIDAILDACLPMIEDTPDAD